MTPEGAPLPVREEETGANGRENPGGRGASPFASLHRVRPPATIGFREAILWSAVVHVFLFAAILFAPRGTLGPAIMAIATGEREPVEMVFVQDPTRASEPNPEARAAADRDRRRAQEERPTNPSRPEPFSRGNTPALIAEGPLGARGKSAAPPAPQRPARPAPPAREPADRPPSGEGERDLRLREGESGLAFREPGEGRGDASGGESDSLQEKGRRLREALSQMGASGSVGAEGGAPFRHDNPVGGLSTPTGSLSFDTKGFDWGPYARRIYWIIWSNWHARMPPAIYTGLKGQVSVHFVIRKDGQITDIEILSPSGVPAYDSAATLALEASSPLPPLPEHFPKESEGVTGRFLYNMWR